MLRSFLRRRRKLLAICLAVAVYAVAMALWVSGSFSSSPKAGVAAAAGPTIPSIGPQLSAGAQPSETSAASSTAVQNRQTGPLHLPALPESSSIDNASAPQHSVVLTITSDRAILRFGYLVKGAHPQGAKGTLAKSPVRIETVGRGYGAMAVVGAQASPDAQYITCRITVDGKLRSTYTQHGGWVVTVCLG